MNTTTITKVSFDEAFEKTGRNIRLSIPTLIIGRAGTGKSTLIRELKKEFPRICLAAPTNLAAKHIGGRTIHRIYNLPNDFYPNKIAKCYTSSRTVLIDEASMYGWYLSQQVERCSGEKTNFVLVGDFGQLPPVNDVSILPFLDRDPHIEKFELIGNYRQADDPEYLEILDELYEKGPTERVMKFVDSRTNIPLPEEFVYLATLNADVNYYNDRFDKTAIGTLVRGHNNRNRIKNNEMGIITGLIDGKLSVRLFGGIESISKTPLNMEHPQMVNVFPADVKIAEGVTLHRIQGKTLSKVVINRNQIHRFPAGLYVAMSRVCHADDVFFVDEECVSRQIFSPQNILEGGRAGVDKLKKEPKTVEKEEAVLDKRARFSLEKISDNKKKYGSNTKLLLSEYYLGTNNGFTVWKRNAVLKELDLIERITHCHRNRFGLFIKTNYELQEKGPQPYFVYTPDYTNPCLNTKDVSIFESLNPMRPGTPVHKRNDKNCFSTTRFLFEVDYHEKLTRRELEEYKAVDLALAKSLLEKGIVNRIVSSGNSGYHCIVETSYEVPDYKAFWQWMNNKYFGGRADPQCAHPSRWTRTPGQKRPDTGKIQRCYGNENRVFDPTEELGEMAQEQERKKNAETRPVPMSREELFKAVADERAREQRSESGSKMKPEALELLNGIFPLDGFSKWGMNAANCLHGFGYSEDEIWKLFEKAGKDKRGKDRREKVKGFVFNNRAY